MNKENEKSPSQTSEPNKTSEAQVCIEIERKFLVSSVPKNLQSFPMTTVRQGYLPLGIPRVVLRVREEIKEGEESTFQEKKYFINIKKGIGLQRTEIHIPIDKQEFLRLWNSTNERIYKQRYFIPLVNNLTAQLDVYAGPLKCFMSVEVEFENKEQASAFVPPAWFGEEKSHDPRYSNDLLAKNGLPE